MYTVRSVVSFEAAHRLYGVNTFSTECRDNIHGHSYKVTVESGVPELNSAGMVIDFKLYKRILKSTIEDKYDHTTILRSIDPLVPAFLEDGSRVNVVEESPTAEWMAEHFYHEIQTALEFNGCPAKVVSVSVQETENNIATYKESDCKCK